MAGEPADNPAQAQSDADEAWAYTASAYAFFVDADDDYVQPMVTADRGWLHLEARYNYEELRTGSGWLGYNLSFGDALVFELTPMLGAVFGRISGIAPGYEAGLSWRWLDLYSEGEYVFDLDERDDSYFYSWSEAAVWPADWFRVGLVGQRTRAYETELDIQRGLLAGLSYRRLTITGYVFNPDKDDSVYVMSVEADF